MVAYMILLISLLVITDRILSKKSLTSFIVIITLIEPFIALGSTKISMSYFIIVYMAILITFAYKKIRFPQQMRKFLYVSIGYIFIFLLGWVLSGAKSPGGFIVSMMGVLKVPILLILLYQTEKHRDTKAVGHEILVGLNVVTILNTLSVIFQKVRPVVAFSFFSNLYGSERSTYYLQSTTEWGLGGFYNGRYTRCFGIFENPMMMGFFTGSAIAFILFYNMKYRKLTFGTYILIVMNFICGALSSTKTFVFILPLIVFAYIVTAGDAKGKRNKYKKFFSVAVVVALVIIVILKFEEIYQFLYSINPGFASKLEYLRNPLEALTTRYGSSSTTGLLSHTIKVIKEHILLGVGPISIEGEPIGDSSIIVILHNGGLIALTMFSLYFFNLCCKLLRNNENLILIMLMILILSSVGLNIVIGSNVAFYIYYLLLATDRRKVLPV